MKITEDVRKYAAEHGLTSEAAIEHGLEEKSREFVNTVLTCMRKHNREGIERRGTTRDRRASPRGREGREEFESMQEKRKEFVEQGAEFTRRRSTVAASLCRGVGAVAAATWFESLAVASRPLQRHLAETNFVGETDPAC